MKSIMGNGGEQSTLIAEDWGYLNPPFGKNIAIASSHMNMTWCNMTQAHATARRNPSQLNSQTWDFDPEIWGTLRFGFRAASTGLPRADPLYGCLSLRFCRWSCCPGTSSGRPAGRV